MALLETSSLRNNVFNTIMSCHCMVDGCEFEGNVKYDNFLHNVRIHRRCILCELNCETKKGIMDHLAFVHHEKTNCDMCGFQVYPFERLKRHLILRHKICSKCGEKFETSMELENHFETVHSDKKLADSLRHSFSCDTCEFVGTKRALKMHKERVHNYKPGPKTPKKYKKEEKSPKTEKKEKPPKLLRSPGKHHQTMPPNHLKPKYIRVGPPPIAPKQIQLPKLIPLQQQPHIIQPQMLMQQQPQMLQQPRKLILQAQIVPQHQQAVQVQALQEVQPQPQRRGEERPDSAEPPQMGVVPRHVEVTPDIEVTPEVNPLGGVKGPPLGENVEKCESCAFSCKKKNEMYIHCIRMHWRCIACKTDYPDKKGIMGHLAAVHGERVQCGMCDFQAYPYERVVRHQINIHNLCEKCGENFPNNILLEEHCENVHKKKMPEHMVHSLKCELCDYQGSKAGVKLHMQRIHRKDDYKFDCDMCDFKTYMKTKLDDHVKLRDKQSANMFFCEKCDFKSCTSYGLVFHRSKIHQITKLMKRYTCGYCWKKFTVMSHFKTHILSKHLEVEGKFACEYCDFKTWDKCYLKKHVQSHEIQGSPNPKIYQKNQDGFGMNFGKINNVSSPIVNQKISQLQPTPGIHFLSNAFTI